jgi:prepilin-type N-terminal cleavage/methylation domain-containing protein
MCYPVNMLNTKKGFSLAEIMIVVGIIALLAAIALPNLIRVKTSGNETFAKASLKTISTALENYASINSTYPPSVNDLVTAMPPYLNSNYFIGEHNGYTFAPTITSYTYQIVATPRASSTGTSTFTMSTGGVLTSN